MFRGTRRRRGRRIGAAIATVFLALVLLYNITPFAWMVLTSLKTGSEAVRIPPTLFPEDVTFRAYTQILVYADFVRYFLNSLVIALGTAIVSAALGSLAGYGFSRFAFRGRAVLLAAILASQMLPGVLLVGPYFEVLSRVGLYNTYVGVILAFTTITLPFSAWMMKGYTDSVPREIDQAAAVDGCTPLRAYLRVVLPLTAPGAVAALAFSFLLAWGDLLWVLVLTTGKDMSTLTLGLTRLVTQFRTVWPQLMAGSVIAVVPCLVLYTWLQRYLVAGMASGATKE
ncbi:MAG: carbohydrate ABC transporter permease [Streptosporangiaceae bacterium]